MKKAADHSKHYAWLVCALFLLVMVALFWQCFLPGYTLFANDGPLGWLAETAHRMPGMFAGTWEDLNSLGFRGGGTLNLSYLLFFALGPVGFSKFDAPIALLVLGFSAYWFFRRLSLAPAACVLGGLAAMLNSGFFSAACWGVATHPLTVAMSFLALGALVETSSSRRWIYAVLAGVAVGIGVAEGADIGAIFSLFIAGFILYQSWVNDGHRFVSVVKGAGRTLLVAAVAGFVAAQTILLLVSTQIVGIAGTQQDTQTKQQHWDFATQWSLPKTETLGFAIPGLFGYRMDTTEGGAYWGAVGRDPSWDRYFAGGKQGPAPQGTMRFSGGGIYTGILVLLIAGWAVMQSFRKSDSIFTLMNRRWIWFWFGIFVISLLLAFGRFAPFYQLLYALPYFSTIRNPAKFTYFCNWAMVVLFGYGVNGLCRVYMQVQAPKPPVGRNSFQAWWQKAQGFDRRWVIGSIGLFAVAALSWLIFASSADAFEKYLEEVQIDPATAHLIAKFSVGQVGLFLIFFGGSIALVILALSGAFRGARATWGVILFGLLLVIDLGRADQPWIITWNYAQKYASNAVIDLLKQEPYKHRVASLPRWILQVFQVPPQLAEAEQYLHQLYGIEWAQHQFLYANIQSLDVVQMPRMPEDLASYEGKFMPQSSADLPRVARHWQLTNTRYLLGAAGFLDLLNRQFDPAQHRFRIAERFNIVPKAEVPHPTKLEDLTATIDTNGPFALFEFSAALPRASLYSRWQVSTNEQATLDELASPGMDPQKSVLVAGNVPPVPTGNLIEAAPKDVNFTRYSPKNVVLAANARSASVLLLNDRFDPNWKVFVDGREEALLRCNYIMRGVFLSPGAHTVEFKFVPSNVAFYVSLSAVTVFVIGCSMLLLLPMKRETTLSQTGSGSPSLTLRSD